MSDRGRGISNAGRSQFPQDFLALGAVAGAVGHLERPVCAQGDDQLSGGKDSAEQPLSRPSRSAPLSERRGALHCLQALRSGVSGARHHHRIGCERRRDAPHHALRHRSLQVHLLRILRGGMSGRCHRGNAIARVPHGESRREHHEQGQVARHRRTLRSHDRGGSRRRRPVSLMFPTVLFFIFAGTLIAAALGVILARNPVYSALLLVLCFFNSAIIWLLLDAEFLGIVLVLVYVGAVMVLFLFVVMMLDINLEELRAGLANYWPLAVAVAGFVVFAMINVIVVKHLGGMAMRAAPPIAAGYSNTRDLGTALFTRYAYPAQIAAIILLVASVAAIVLTLRRRTGAKPQNIALQVAANPKNRIRIVKMASEKRP